MTHTTKDRIYAWLMFLLGYGFVDTFTSEGMEQKLPVFTAAYLFFMAAYFYQKQRDLPKESYFWIIIVACLGLCYSEQGIIFPLIQLVVLITAAAYLVLCMGGNLLGKQCSSQWVIVDLWNAIIVVPFYNFLCHIKTLFSSLKKESSRRHDLRSILLGICITIPLLCVIIPLLSSADQNFAAMFQNFQFHFFSEAWRMMIPRAIISLPVTAYLFGLMYGSANKRNTNHFERVELEEHMQQSRILPDLAACTVVSVVCIFYLFFIGLQGSYLFSAFIGSMPENYTYAEYARQGFFELCYIAVLNLILLIGFNTFCKSEHWQSCILRYMNLLLSALTILLIGTAMSKMILYITVYGLTAKRITTTVFMFWLLLIYLMMMLSQYKKLPLVKLSLYIGAVLYTLLCVLPVYRWISLY